MAVADIAGAGCFRKDDRSHGGAGGFIFKSAAELLSKGFTGRRGVWHCVAIYHCSIKVISRGKGKSAVAAAAYRAGEKITNQFDGMTHDYTHKGGVVHTEILLPDHAPAGYTDRAVLWNEVEKIEKAKNAQLAREIEISLPRELTRAQSISLVREYVKRHFVAAGMCADVCLHDTGGGNPHAHIMLTMRPFDERGDLNREIEVTNQKLRQLKARISKLQKWLKEEQENTEPPTLADYIQGILSRKTQAGKQGYSQSLYNLKDAAKMLNFLQANSIIDMAGLDEKFKSMIGEQLDIQGKLKPVERWIATLKKHLEQADIYFKCKGKKPLTEAEQILFTTAKDYLKGVMNGKTTIPTKTWKEEYTKLTAERKTLNQRYLALKEEVKEAEKIRKSVYSILRQEQREQQPHRKQDMER